MDIHCSSHPCQYLTRNSLVTKSAYKTPESLLKAFGKTQEEMVSLPQDIVLSAWHSWGCLSHPYQCENEDNTKGNRLERWDKTRALGAWLNH